MSRSPLHAKSRISLRNARRGLFRTVLLSGGALVLPALALAQTLPQGGAFVAGTGSIAGAGSSLTVTQSSQRGIVTWQSFSVGGADKVAIDNGSGATLNRVTGAALSQIQGQVTATGSVYLINPNGVVVGPGGSVVAGGSAVLSTRPVADAGFMAGGGLTFSGTSSGSVVNLGRVVAQGGNAVLIGQSASNAGTLSAPNGTAALAAGNTVVLSEQAGPAGVYVAPDAVANGDATNTGRIKAAAAELASAGGNVYALAGNRRGLIQATGTRTVAGQVWLTAPNGAATAASSRPPARC